MGDPFADPPPVDLQLGFAGSPRPDTASLAGKMTPLPHQTGKQVKALGQFHLKLTLFGPGPLSEDVENETRSIHDFEIELGLQVTILGGRQVLVEDHEIRFGLLGRLRKFLDLAPPDEKSGINAADLLAGGADDAGSGAIGEVLQLF